MTSGVRQPIPPSEGSKTASRAIEMGFPIVEINRLAEPERNSFKPIYQIHKWFARRASCVFRAAPAEVPGCVILGPDTERIALLVGKMCFATHTSVWSIASWKMRGFRSRVSPSRGSAMSWPLCACPPEIPAYCGRFRSLARPDDRSSRTGACERHGGLTLMEMLTPWLVLGPVK
jgi:hypothetical protein